MDDGQGLSAPTNLLNGLLLLFLSWGAPSAGSFDRMPARLHPSKRREREKRVTVLFLAFVPSSVRAFRNVSAGSQSTVALGWIFTAGGYLFIPCSTTWLVNH